MSTVRAVILTVGDWFIWAQPFLNGIIGLAVVSYIGHRLLCCADQYSRPERLGMAAVASGMIMATPALWLPDTPFDGWSFNVARFGLALYIITGGMRRDRHHKANKNQRAYALGFRDGKQVGEGKRTA